MAPTANSTSPQRIEHAARDAPARPDPAARDPAARCHPDGRLDRGFVARRRLGAVEQGHRNTIHPLRLVGGDAMVASQLVGQFVAGASRGGADDLAGDAAVRALPGLAATLPGPAPTDSAAGYRGASGRTGCDR